jgi:catechol 2,3-dioxygenase-like lactoylglutathione lyase family enzyme
MPGIFSRRCTPRHLSTSRGWPSELDTTEKTLTGLLGAKKWVRMPGAHFGADSCTYRGMAADFVADISLSYVGDMQPELIAPVRDASIYTEFLDHNGLGLHHICVEAADTDDFDAALRDAERQGATVVQLGVMPGGMQFAYVAAAAAGVPCVEIAHIAPEIRAFFEYVKREQR